MAQFTDAQELGVLPLQDHEQNVPIGVRQQLLAGRIDRIGEMGSGDGGIIHLALEQGKTTIGDVHPWFFWQTEDRDDRASGSFAQAFAGIITKGVSSGASSGGGRTGTVTPGSPAEIHPIQTGLYHSDTRFHRKIPGWPKCFPDRVGGQIHVIMPGTEESGQHDLMLHADPRLVCPQTKGPYTAGTLVVDLQGAGELCMGNSATPGFGGRAARIQSAWRVIALASGAGGNSIAWNHTESVDGAVGYGMIFSKMPKGSQGPTTPRPKQGPVTPGPTPPQQGPTTGPRSAGATNNTFGSVIGGDESPVAGVPFGDGGASISEAKKGKKGGKGKQPNEEPEERKTPCEFGSFAKSPRKGYGVALMAQIGACGPIHPGYDGDKHQIGHDEDGHPINSAHVSTNAYFIQNVTRDGPLLFEGDFPKNVKEHAIKTHVHLSWDESLAHKWVGGSKPGMWRWWTTVPYYRPSTNTPIPPTTPRRPNVPNVPGPTTPGPNVPGAPGPVTPPPNGPRTPRVPGPVTPPPRQAPTAPIRPGPGPGRSWTKPITPPRKNGVPVGPKTGSPNGPGYPIPGGATPPGGGGGDSSGAKMMREGSGDDFEDTNGNKLGNSEILVRSGDGRQGTGSREQLNDHADRLVQDPATGQPFGHRQRGVRATVGESDRSDIGDYSLLFPVMTGFASTTFRPQLWAHGYPSFDHNPYTPDTLVEADEALRPHVLSMHAFGAQGDSGDWDYNVNPETSRARGGTGNGGIMFHPPRFTMEDYYGINSTVDVTDTLGNDPQRSVVLHTPGVQVAFGLPKLDGTVVDGGFGIRVAASELLISQRSSGADSGLLGMSLTGTEKYVDVKGTTSMRIPAGTTAQRPSSSVDGGLRVNTTSGGLEFYVAGAWASAGGGGGASAFTGLTDTPAAYVGRALDVVRVNAGETALEFVDVVTAPPGNPGDMVALDALGEIDSGFIDARNFSHTDLLNLTSDDHTQYLLASGSRAMTGALAMGTNKITGLVAGTAAGEAVEVTSAVATFVAKNGSTMTGDLTLQDSVKLTLGTGGDADLYYDGTNVLLDPKVVGSGYFRVVGTTRHNDNEKLILGSGGDSELYYNGTNLIVEPNAVGAGIVDVLGTLNADELSSDGGMTATGTCEAADYSCGGAVGVDSGGTFQWFDRDDGQHDVTICNGIVTEWTYTP